MCGTPRQSEAAIARHALVCRADDRAGAGDVKRFRKLGGRNLQICRARSYPTGIRKFRFFHKFALASRTWRPVKQFKKRIGQAVWPGFRRTYKTINAMKRFILSLLLSAAPFTVFLDAQSFSFTTGSPDGLLATASRPESAGKIEIESAEDVIASTSLVITSA